MSRFKIKTWVNNCGDTYFTVYRKGWIFWNQITTLPSKELAELLIKRICKGERESGVTYYKG